MDAEKTSVMKSFWNRIKDDIFVWLVFYFIFSLPLTVNGCEHFISSEMSNFGADSVALDHVGGSPGWYPYYYWYIGHRQSSFLFATIALGFYKTCVLMYRKLKTKNVKAV